MKVIVPGTFDLFHEGHKELIDYAWKIGGEEEIIIIINDDQLSKDKGKKLSEDIFERVSNVTSYIEDKEMCAEIIICDFEDLTVRVALHDAPCIWLTGRDWDMDKTSERNNVEPSFWRENNIYLLYKDRVPDISSTELRK